MYKRVYSRKAYCGKRVPGHISERQGMCMVLIKNSIISVNLGQFDDENPLNSMQI